MGGSESRERAHLRHEYAQRVAAHKSLASGDLETAAFHEQVADMEGMRAQQTHWKRYRRGQVADAHTRHIGVSNAVTTVPPSVFENPQQQPYYQSYPTSTIPVASACGSPYYAPQQGGGVMPPTMQSMQSANYTAPGTPANGMYNYTSMW